jgi:hypothetical protein
MADSPIDFATDAAPASRDKLDTVLAWITNLDLERADLQRASEAVSKLQSEIALLETKTIPDAMAAAGVTSLTLADGRTVSVEREVHCGITATNLAVAHEWLRRSGNDSIIRRVVGLKFGRGQDVVAAELLAKLKEQFPEVETVNTEAVHPQTLKAFVKECVREGTDIPEHPFGIFKINRAIIRSAKK